MHVTLFLEFYKLGNFDWFNTSQAVPLRDGAVVMAKSMILTESNSYASRAPTGQGSYYVGRSLRAFR